MLGNQYFLSRRFEAAKPVYENLIGTSFYSDKIAKKLIVCYSVTHDTNRAFQLFYNLIQKDPRIISNTKFYEEDCPCPEILPQILSEEIVYENADEKYLALGMLSLYCNISDSLKYFNKLRDSSVIDKGKLNNTIAVINKIKLNSKTN
ncbi:MAG: hypothetical protein U5K00_04620 [Melioribacteraceae bacterium]|nr:hypothetical protein [Melioribacteraceae bacterium]